MGWAPVLTDTGARDPSANGSRFDQGKTAHHGHVQAGERTMKRATGLLRPSCDCSTDLPPRPGVVLDPFSGSGTVGLVARALRRHSILVEASATYLPLARERLGLEALKAWEQGEAAHTVTVSDLPLFAGGTP